MMNSLDGFFPHLGSQDTKKKIVIGDELLNFIENDDNSIECEDMSGFIEEITKWFSSSNFKLSLCALDIVDHLIGRLGTGFRPFLNTILVPASYRLGDSREIVRSKANHLIMRVMEDVSDPQSVFEKLIDIFSHKNSRIREEILIMFSSTLDSHGTQKITISRFLPSIVALLRDPTPSVREAASATIVEIYKHVGERVRADLQKKYEIPSARLAGLMEKFDDLRDKGELMPTAFLVPAPSSGSKGEDETDRHSGKSNGSSYKSRSSSVPAVRRGYGTLKPPSGDASGRSSASSFVRRTPSIHHSGSSSSGNSAGAVDEESFLAAFEDVKKVTIYSGRSLSDELNKIRETLTKTSNDWKVRVEALQSIRCLIASGAGNYVEFTSSLKTLEVSFISSVKDLRSQLVREACITIAYMAQQLTKIDRFLEALFQIIINLIPNSAKVMSTSGITCIRFIIQYTYSQRLIPIITSNVDNKSREIRRYCCEFLDNLLHTWPTHPLEKHILILSAAIKKGITDADPDARTMARKAYWGFADHFKEQADILLNSLDGTYRRLLQKGEMSNSSSSNSLNATGKPTSNTMTLPRSRQSSITSSQENLIERKPSSSTLTRKTSGIPLYTSPIKHDSVVRSTSLFGTPQNEDPLLRSFDGRVRTLTSISNGTTKTPPARSNSAIDPSAVRRANVRAQYAQRNRIGVTTGASLPRPRKSSDKGPTPDSASRNGRTRSRVGGSVSQSQPSSRSTSPTSLKCYQTYYDPNSPGGVITPIRRRSGIPRSTGPSREASPNRFGSSPSSYTPKFRSGKAALGLAASVDRPPRRPYLTEQILKQSRDAESALEDALKTPRKRSLGGNGLFTDDGSDDSETSSLCSEKSVDYERRRNEDIGDIISNCGSSHFADRKDGLIALQIYLRDNRMLTATELKRVTEIFSKMFMDPHTKVFSLFLEALNELIHSHKEDLIDWLHVLITRLLNKQGADLLGSVKQKIVKTSDIVIKLFPHKDQFNVLNRFLVDQAQTPNIKVKQATLKYMSDLVSIMDPEDLPKTTGMDMGLAKVITWTCEPKSSDVRKAANNTLICLFDAHAPYFTSLLLTLPKTYQDNAAGLVQKYLTYTASPMKPRSLVHSPNSRISPGRFGGASGLSSDNSKLAFYDPIDNSENLNPEEISRSLRSTANAIQNYSFDMKDDSLNFTNVETLEDCLRKMNMKDLAFSPSTPKNNNSENTIDAHNLENLARERAERFLSSVQPKGFRSLPRNSFRNWSKYHNHSFKRSLKRRVSTPRSITDEESNSTINQIISDLQGVKNNSRSNERRASMTQLIKMTKDGNIGVLEGNFRTVLRLLLENLSDETGIIRALVLNVLSEMLKKDQLVPSFQGFTELIILKILESHKDEEKDVERAAEACAGDMAKVFSADLVIRVLNPIIKTGDYPMNLAAIKMLTKVSEHEINKECLSNHLPELMPGLLKAYDNVESTVRKAAVFCMVALHQLLGVNIRPYLDSLNGSKLKLLDLYIKRAQAQSAPGSPRLTPS